MKKIVIAVIVCLLMFAGCANEAQQDSLAGADTELYEFRLTDPGAGEGSEPEEDDIANSPSTQQESNPEDYFDMPDGRSFFDMFDEPAVLLQFEPLTPGEELVVFHTNHGDITLRLFPDEVPLTVENFLTHDRDGYYDGVIFHRVIQDFMVQGGDPDGTGMGGETIWGEPFFTKWMIWQLFDEVMPDDVIYELPSINLKHFRGALAMAHAGGVMGSQFYIVQNSNPHPGVPGNIENIIMQLSEFGEVPEGFIQTMDAVAALYAEHGGTPHLDWWWDFMSGHIVFGHVVEGMEIVDAIAGAPVDAGSRPVEDIIIESVSFVIYE